MTKKTLEQLQEEHSHLCAVAADLGMGVPEDLTIDFDSAEVGSTVVSNLESLIRKFKDGIDQKDVAGVAKSGHPDKPKKKSGTAKPRTKAKPAADAKPRTKAKPAADAKQVEESTMATAKKPKSKKTAKVAKTKTVKKNGSHKTDKVISMLKRSGGCTREQVLEATGWPSISMQALAKSGHVKLKVDKSERPFRYSAA